MALLWKMICNLGDSMSLRHPLMSHLNATIASFQSVCTSMYEYIYMYEYLYVYVYTKCVNVHIGILVT